jgi:hypothetical protein
VEEKRDKYFEYLLSQSARYEVEVQEFNQKIKVLLNDPVDTMGIILKCNLIIENYIDDYLKSAYPTINFEFKDRLTYNQKIELIDNKKMNFHMFINGVKELNSIRNKYAHNLYYKVQPNTFSEITKIITIWNNAAGKKVNDGIQLIIDFTVYMCMFLFASKNEISLNGSGLGLPKYFEWLDEMKCKK